MRTAYEADPDLYREIDAERAVDFELERRGRHEISRAQQIRMIHKARCEHGMQIRPCQGKGSLYDCFTLIRDGQTVVLWYLDCAYDTRVIMEPYE